MPITRRDFYKLALGSSVGLAVLKNSPTALAQGISLKKPLPYGAGQKGETAGGLPPEGSRIGRRNRNNNESVSPQ